MNKLTKMTKRLMLLIGGGALALSAVAETPDFYADTLKSDGVGYVDLGYTTHAISYPRTTRFVLKFNSSDYGKGTAPGPVVDRASPLFFGDDQIKLGYNGGNKGWARLFGLSGSSSYVRDKTCVTGDNTIEVDYANEKCIWGTVTLTGTTSLSADSTISLYLFARHNETTEANGPAVIAFQSLKLYEKETSESDEALKGEYVPCFANGQPAVYEKESQTILYPTSEGFTVNGYDITTVAGRKLIVNAKDCAPRSLTLVADSELAFDGAATLAAPAGTTLPASGAVTVSLSALSGQGRYVLISGLPSDFDLSAFQLGSVPDNNTGILSKDGTDLVLTLTGKTDLPDAFAETLTSDAHGYIDTGYKFKATGDSHTSRILFDFYSTSYAKGKAPGPTVSATTAALFGYQVDSVDRYVLRYLDKKKQVIYKGNNTQVSVAETGNLSIACDFDEQSVAWGSSEMASIVSPTVNSDCSFYLFANNYQAVASDKSVFDFKRMAIYEKDAEANESLALDLRPCVNAGRLGVCDLVSRSVLYPLDSTNGFVAAGVTWRLTANGETQFASGDVTVTSATAGEDDGWIAIRDRDGVVVARGTGATAAFTMPEAAVTVRWPTDLAVAASRTFNAATYADDVTVADGVTLSFASDAVLYAAGEVALPASDTVTVAMTGLRAAGVFTLIDGVDENASLASFTVGALPDGFSGQLERHGRRLVLRVTGAAATVAALPDALAATLKSDGVGYINTEYLYKGATYPRTSRMTFAYKTTDYAQGTAPGPVAESGTPFPFGYNELGVRYFVNNKYAILIGSGGKQSEIKVRNAACLGDMAIACDFFNDTASLGDTSVTDFTASDSDATSPFYVFARNKNGEPENISVFDFKRMSFYEKPEGGDETLVHDFVPCVKDGAVGLYDAVTGDFRYPTADTNGFTVTGLSWPEATFGAPISQRFSYATTVSYRPVTVPAFAAEDTYMFVADGSITLATAVDSLIIRRYAANGDELVSESYGALAAGTMRLVQLDGAIRAVVTVTGTASGESVVQDFGIVEAVAVGEAQMKQIKKRIFDFRVDAATTFTAKVRLAQVQVGAYDDEGQFVATGTLAAAVPIGGTFVADGSTTPIIVRVNVQGPGMVLIFK